MDTSFKLKYLKKKKKKLGEGKKQNDSEGNLVLQEKHPEFIIMVILINFVKKQKKCKMSLFLKGNFLRKRMTEKCEPRKSFLETISRLDEDKRNV